jgi:hypothetical protein
VRSTMLGWELVVAPAPSSWQCSNHPSRCGIFKWAASCGMLSPYKILEIDLARSVFSCLSCRALRWQQSCHRGMEVRSMLFGKQVHTMSGLEFLREKVRTDMIYWIILICTDVLLTSHQWTLAILPGPWSCHLNCVGLRLEACLSLHLPTQLQSVLWDEDYAGTRHYEGKRRYHPLASYSASYYFILFPVASAPYTALCKMSTLEAFWFAHSVSHWLAKLAQV